MPSPNPLGDQEYEPPNRVLSASAARRQFVSELCRIEPAIVDSLERYALEDYRAIYFDTSTQWNCFAPIQDAFSNAQSAIWQERIESGQILNAFREWRALAACDRLGFPELRSVRDSLLAWQSRWQLLTTDQRKDPFGEESWPLQYACYHLNHLCGYPEEPMLGRKRRPTWELPGLSLNPPFPIADFAFSFPSFNYTFPLVPVSLGDRQYMPTVTASEWSVLIDAAFADAKRQHLKQALERAESAGYVRAPVKHEDNHFRWAALYFANPSASHDDVVKRLEGEGVYKTRGGVRTAINAVTDLLGLQRRDSSPSGRPRGTKTSECASNIASLRR